MNKDGNGTREQKNFGTLVIGATKDHTPFIEAYDGLPPHEKVDKVKEIARIHNADEGGYKYIFLRNFDYGVELESDGEAIKVNLRTKKVIPAGKPVQIGQEKQKEIRKQWNHIEKIIESSSVGGVQAQASSVLISDVPFYLWYRGCSPSAAGMVMGYWHYHGYPNLPTGNTVIDELADAMGTSSSGATWPWRIDDGIRTVASNHGYNFGSTTYYGTGYWGTYKSEINNARPMVISIAVDLSGPYDDHSFAGVGYYEPHFWEKDAIVQDTWDTAWHYVNILETVGIQFESVIP